MLSDIESYIEYMKFVSWMLFFFLQRERYSNPPHGRCLKIISNIGHVTLLIGLLCHSLVIMSSSLQFCSLNLP